MCGTGSCRKSPEGARNLARQLLSWLRSCEFLDEVSKISQRCTESGTGAAFTPKNGKIVKILSFSFLGPEQFSVFPRMLFLPLEEYHPANWSCLVPLSSLASRSEDPLGEVPGLSANETFCEGGQTASGMKRASLPIDSQNDN
jgi:hypothetical protein